jgi:glutaminyl-peptide cyclotransferase
MAARFWLVGGAALVALGGLAAWAFWPGNPVVLSVPQSPDAPAGRDQFAADRAADAAPWAFDADRAMRYLNRLCELGPRVSGTDGMRRQQDLLKEHFEKLGGQVRFQKFTARQVSRPQPVEMTNVIITWRPQAARRVIFCGHYDTRPMADQEPDRNRWREPFMSANDGTSTTAFLMELAHHVAAAPLNVGLDFVLFDGEEYVFDAQNDRYFLGSEHFAAQYLQRRPGDPVYLAAILLDLFAGTNARIAKEPNSVFLAGFLVEDVWRTAARLNVPAFVQEQAATAVQDDHLALNRVGIPAIDVIDFSYPHWHRLSDKPENVSGPVMAQVAKVLTVWVQGVR